MPRPAPNDPERGARAAAGSSDEPGNTGHVPDPDRAFAMMEADDRADRRDGLTDEDSTPLSSRDTPSSDFDSGLHGSSDIDTVDEPDSTGGGTAGVESEVLRAQAGESSGGSLPDPHASSARQGSLVGPPARDRQFRPQLRPPTPVLEVLDDDLCGSEKIRLRRRTFTMGRVQGDLTLPNDRVMSRRHAELFLESNKTDGSFRWMLRDLKSVNGSFLRVPEIQLSDRERLWLGGDLTRVAISKRTGEITLHELKNNDADRATCGPGVHWIGLGEACIDFLRASPFLDDRGFRLESDAAGRWKLSDNGSTNGLWRSIDEAPVELSDGCQFKLGEQHFLFRLP